MSFGHVQDMNNRMKQNRAALNSKQVKFKERKLFNIKHKGSGLVVEDIDLTREELNQLKAEIREEIRSGRIWRWVKVILIAVVIFGVSLSVGLYYLFSD